MLQGKNGDLLKEFLISTLNISSNCHDTIIDRSTVISEGIDKSTKADLDSGSCSQEVHTVCAGDESVTLSQVNGVRCKSAGKCFIENM